MKLYEIAQQYRALDALLDASGGEITPEIQSAIDALEGTLEDKVDGYLSLVREAEAEAEAIEEEAARLRERAGANWHKAKRLRAALFDGLKAAGVAKVKTRRFTVWTQKASMPSIEWPGDLDGLPGDFRRLRYELNRTAAQEYLAAHGTLPPGFKVTYSEFLQVR